jgi:hypothetical protein
MSENYTKGEMHGCVVCGKLYELYVVYDANNRFIDCKVMSFGGKRVPDAHHPLAACEKHSPAEIEEALARAYKMRKDDD